MEFRESGDEIISFWEPDEHFQGFSDILHGGIQATMMDEIASWVVFVKLGTAGVTRRLNTIYRKPVRLSAGGITLRAKLVGTKRNLATIGVTLYDGAKKACSEGVVEYFLLSAERALKEMYYPGKEAFTTDERDDENEW